MANESLMTVGEVARLAEVSAVTVYRRVKSGRLPRPVSADGVAKWRRSEVEAVIGEEQVLVTTQEAMQMLGVSRPTIFAMVKDGRLPPPHPLGNANYWRRVDVEALAAASRPNVIAIDPGAGAEVDRQGRLVQYGAGALTPADVEAPSDVREAAASSLEELRETLARAQDLVNTLETRGVPIAAEPDPERVERLKQQVALRNQRFDDYPELRHEEALEYDRKLVSTRAAMEWLQISRGTLLRMVEDGRVTPPVRRGGKDHWLRDELEAAIAAARDPEPEVQANREKIRQDIALLGLAFGDLFDMILDEKFASAQQQPVVLNVVTEEDGKLRVDVPLGEEAIEASGLVIALPPPEQEGERRAALIETLREAGYTVPPSTLNRAEVATGT